MSHPHFEELAPNESHVFYTRISAAKKANPMGAAVDIHKRSEYKGMKMFMTRDGTAGYAVKPTGELTSVFKHPDSPHENVAAKAAEHASLMAGATHFSAFDPLPGMYQKGGGKAHERTPWNEDYKASAWRTTKMGRPDVAYGSLGPKTTYVETHPEKREVPGRNETSSYTPGVQPQVEDYDAGMEKAKSIGETRLSGIRSAMVKLRQRNYEFGTGHDGAKF
jgi:hypothetical protein